MLSPQHILKSKHLTILLFCYCPKQQYHWWHCQYYCCYFCSYYYCLQFVMMQMTFYQQYLSVSRIYIIPLLKHNEFNGLNAIGNLDFNYSGEDYNHLCLYNSTVKTSREVALRCDIFMFFIGLFVNLNLFTSAVL